MTLSAAILAGGQARRYGGRDKSALVVDGRSIRERQLEALAPIAHDILIVGSRASLQSGEGARPDDPAEKNRAEPRQSVTIREVGDRVPGCGPLGGLHAALLEATGDATFVVACDMPYISTAFVRHLAALAADADAVVPRTDRGYHPLCAVYTRACLAPAARRLAERQLKMIDLFEDLRVRVVDANELGGFGDVRRLLTNINSPADLEELDAIEASRDRQPSS